jgi:hypothetical protein
MSALWECLTALLPVLLAVAALVIVALILDALGSAGKW